MRHCMSGYVLYCHACMPTGGNPAESVSCNTKRRRSYLPLLPLPLLAPLCMAPLSRAVVLLALVVDRASAQTVCNDTTAENYGEPLECAPLPGMFCLDPGAIFFRATPGARRIVSNSASRRLFAVPRRPNAALPSTSQGE